VPADGGVLRPGRGHAAHVHGALPFPAAMAREADAWEEGEGRRQLAGVRRRGGDYGEEEGGYGSGVLDEEPQEVMN